MRKDLNCHDIQSRMKSLKTLKDVFDIAFEDTKTNPSVQTIQKARILKQQLQSSLEALKQPLFQHCIQEKTLLDYPLFSDLIARNKEEIDERTKVYIGPLKKDIFQHRSPTIDYIYTKYPEQRIYREDLEVGGHSVEEIKQMLTDQNHRISDHAKAILDTPTFKQSLYTDPPQCTEIKQSETLNLIHITVAQLGFTGRATTKEIYDRAQEFGLQLCPPSVGPYYRLQYKDQPKDEWRTIGMDPIDVGDPYVVRVGRLDDDSWLDGAWADPTDEWHPDNLFVFCLRKVDS